MKDMNVNAEITTGNLSNSGTNPMYTIQAPTGVGQVRKNFTGVLATSTSVMTPATLYTVTAGKTFYLTDIVVTNNSVNASAVSLNNSVTAGSGPIATGHSINTSPFSMVNIGSEPSIAAGLPVVLQLGITSVITSCAYSIYGYEQ